MQSPWKSVWTLLKKPETGLPYDPTQSQQSTDPKDAAAYFTDACSSMLATALVTKARD